MRSTIGKRLTALECRTFGAPRLVCLKATMGEDWSTVALMRAVGDVPRATDTVVVVRKPPGTGGPDRMLYAREVV